jgi:hypothetical protein
MQAGTLRNSANDEAARLSGPRVDLLRGGTYVATERQCQCHSGGACWTWSFRLRIGGACGREPEFLLQLPFDGNDGRRINAQR